MSGSAAALLPVTRASAAKVSDADPLARIAQRADRLVDGLIACGDIDAVAERTVQHQRAGADHVAINVISDSPDELPIDKWRSLAATVVAEAP
jgi:hypothetical protein